MRLKHSGKLTYRKSKGYTRDLGWKVGANGKRHQPRFLLGHDERAAQLANMKLEALWQSVVEESQARQNVAYWAPPESIELVWDERSLEIAHLVRRGLSVYRVPGPAEDLLADFNGAAAYAAEVHHLAQRYSSVITVLPADSEFMLQGQSGHQQFAEHRARQARNNAAIAQMPIPQTDTNQTLYQGLQTYAEFAKANGKGGANEPKDALSMRDAIADMTLSQFDFDAIQKLGDYWRTRPPSRRHGSDGTPIATSTVRNRLKTARRFIRWLNRSSSWNWRAPTEWEEGLRMDEKRLRTEEELLSTAEGPATWTIDELCMLYRHATNRERCLLLMGLNLGFAQSECISFRKEDVKLDADPPQVRRVRRKTGKYFSASLWPETIETLDWLHRHQAEVEPDGNPWVLLSQKGTRPTGQDIANMWNRLLDRVGKNHSDFRRLSFKYLRKTAYQLVLEASGSMEIAGTFEARGQLSVDEQADRYGRRLFDRVFNALDIVRQRLDPLFICNMGHTESLDAANHAAA